MESARADCAGCEGAEKSRGDALAGHVADAKAEAMLIEIVEVEKISGQFARGEKMRRGFPPSPLGRLLREEALLNSLSDRQFLPVTRLSLRDVLVEPGVLDRHRHLRRERCQDFDVLVGESVQLFRLEVENPDHPSFEDERYDQFRPNVRLDGDVPRVLSNVAHDDRFF